MTRQGPQLRDLPAHYARSARISDSPRALARFLTIVEASPVKGPSRPKRKLSSARPFGSPSDNVASGSVFVLCF